MTKRSMKNMSYGFSKPEDLIEKLRRDGVKLSTELDPDSIFNFLVTAASTYDWIKQSFPKNELINAITASLTVDCWETMPVQIDNWIEDRSCIPNKYCDVRRHVLSVLRICNFSANASKHFHWEGKIKAIELTPIVGNWYQYFFTSTAQDLYIDYDGEVYGLSQVRDIAQQFFDGLIKHLRAQDPT